MPLVTTEISEGVAIVTLNRPEAMNALSKALRAELAEAMLALANDDAVRAVVLTGAGHRAFTAGLDLKELGASTEGLGAANATDPRDNPVKAVEQCAKPVIGAINGVAITGGFEVALACDMLIASDTARFADTHARVGVMPGWGLSQKLSRLIGMARAKELSLSGNFLDAATAERWGLVNRVVAPDALLPAAIALAAESGQYDGFVAIGVVIRGETYHFEIVAGESARAIMALTMDGIAIGNGILTVENEIQAQVRADPAQKNKGGEAAHAAIALLDIAGKFAPRS